MFGVPVWVFVAVFVAMMIVVATVKKPEVVLQGTPEKVVGEDKSDDGIEAEGNTDLSSATMKPLCPHCKAGMGSFHWIATDSPAPDILYMCPACRTLLNIMERSY